MAGIAVLFVALLMQEHASRVATFLILEPCRAVFCCTVLGLEISVAVLRAMDGLDAAYRFFGTLKSDVDT